MKHSSDSNNHSESAGERKQLVTFKSDRYWFGIDVMRVQEVLSSVQMTVVPTAPEVIRGLINLRGQIITAIDIRKALNLPPVEREQSSMNVVVRSEDETLSLLVDEIGDVMDVNPQQFEETPRSISALWGSMVYGVYKLENSLLLGFSPDALCVDELGEERK